MDISNLTYELRKCKDCSCSRCYLNGTDGCFVDIAVRELNRYEQAMDSIDKFHLATKPAEELIFKDFDSIGPRD